jgi:hypothetical protein
MNMEMMHRISKKGTTEMWWIIVGAIIALLMVIFILLWFKGSGTKAYGNIESTLDSLGDCDEDGVSNMFDKCPCITSGNTEDPENRGCPNDKAGARKCEANHPCLQKKE